MLEAELMARDLEAESEIEGASTKKALAMAFAMTVIRQRELQRREWDGLLESEADMRALSSAASNVRRLAETLRSARAKELARSFEDDGGPITTSPTPIKAELKVIEASPKDPATGTQDIIAELLS